MRLKNIRRIAAAITLAAAPLVSGIVLPGVAHADPATGTYLWTGNSGSTDGEADCDTNCWSVKGNWNVWNGTAWESATSAPSTGANLLFDESGSVLITNVAMTDDIPGLSVGNIATEVSTGSASNYTYSLSGYALTITGGVANVAADGDGVQVQPVFATNDLTFSGSQAFGDSSDINENASISTTGTVAVDSGTLVVYEYGLDSGSSVSVASGAELQVLGGNTSDDVSVASGATLQVGGYVALSTLSGAGNIVILTPTSGNYPTVLYLYGNTSPNSFSGSFDVQKGAQLLVDGGLPDSTPANALGTAQLTIENGGQLYVEAGVTGSADTGTVNIGNTITVGGNGAAVDQMQQGAIVGELYVESKSEPAGTLAVNFTGNVTLSANTSLASEYATATTYNFTGTLNKAGHTFSVVAEAQPTYGTTIVQVNGAAVAGGTSGTSVKAPGTPDTGFALTAAHDWVGVMASVLAAGGIWLAARRVKPATK